MNPQLWRHLKQTPARPRPLVVESFGVTDRGRVRSINEDQFLIAELARALRVRHSSLPQPSTLYGDVRGQLFLVADGVGGEAGGDEASALAVGSVEDFALNALKSLFDLDGEEADQLLSDFEKALSQADERILKAAEQHPELHGMGTTVTLAFELGSTLFVTHVGDSRCYLLRNGVLCRLTKDHTLVAEMVRRGIIQPEEAAENQFRHVITNVVGGNVAGLQPEVHRITLNARDVLLLCSDGLTEMLSDEQIAGVLTDELDPRSCCERLVANANDAGGRDNITVIVARFDSPVQELRRRRAVVPQ